MKTILFADDTVLVQNDNNLGKLRNSVNREMTNVTDWLTTNKLLLNISKTKHMSITNIHVNTESFAITANGNRIERTLICKYLVVIVDEKLTWKEHCKQLCCTISTYVGVMWKLHHVNNQALRMLYHSLINSRAQYGIIAWGRAASCHLQPISVVSNRAMRYLNTNELVTSKVTTIYKTQKIIQRKQCFPNFFSIVLPSSTLMTSYQTPPSTKNKNTCTVFIVYCNNIMSNSVAVTVTDEAGVLLSACQYRVSVWCETILNPCLTISRRFLLLSKSVITALKARSSK